MQIPAICDGLQMRRAAEIGSSFNIIDIERGEKADLIPLSMDRRIEPAFEKRIRRTIEMVGMDPFSVWVARPEDMMVGKLMAWQESRSERYTADIFEMLLFHYLGEPDAGTRLMRHMWASEPDNWGKRSRKCGSNLGMRRWQKRNDTHRPIDLPLPCSTRIHSPNPK